MGRFRLLDMVVAHKTRFSVYLEDNSEALCRPGQNTHNVKNYSS